jgi:hypothetical protein
MDVVLADGSLRTITPASDIWWAMKGAGHNYGIVTSVTTRIFDVQRPDWAIETLVFSGDKVEAVYQAANNLLQNGRQRVDVINWSYWLNNPGADPNKVRQCSLSVRIKTSLLPSLYAARHHLLYYSRRCQSR